MHLTSRRIALSVCLLIASACTASRSAPSADGAVVPPDPAERIRRVETGLLTYHVVPGEPQGGSIQERMRFYHVPGVSVAVIEDGEIAWARGWGEAQAGSGVPVDTSTLFQAASISKPVAAAGALVLVEEGTLGLDEDVNLRLRSWKVPENGHTAAEKVTLRRLLSHSAGLTVHGFPGYSEGAALPTLVEILEGAAPANTAPVRVDLVPGSRWRYSGGGTTVVQLLMQDVTGAPFAEWMYERVLVPAGMPQSTFEQPLPEQLRGRAATGHRGDGTPIAGQYHTYPEQAAAGLWTTPSDLARFAIAIQRSGEGRPGALLPLALSREMLTPQAERYGVGFALAGDGRSLVFQHGGSNAGFQSFLAASATSGRGVVVMTNGDGGSALAQEVLRSVAREYGIPGFEPVEREALALDAASLRSLEGDYYPAASSPEATPILRIRWVGGELLAEIPRIAWLGRRLRAASASELFFLESPGLISFERGAAGEVTGARVTGLGEPVQLQRRDS